MLIKHGILKGQRLFVKFELQSNNYGTYEKMQSKVV